MITLPSTSAPQFRTMADSDGSGGASAAPRTDPLANKAVFLQLLVAQIKNQDPLNPTDGVQFLSQLSQFTTLEQTMGMRGDLEKILGALQELKPSADKQT